VVVRGEDALGVPFEDGRLVVRDGRTVAWRAWGRAMDRPVVRLQGSAGSRLARGPNPLAANARIIMIDRPGFGASTRLPGRGLSAVADDLIELLDHLGIETTAVIARSAGGPHGLALAAKHPDRVRSLTIVSGGCPVTAQERSGLVAANAQLGEVLDKGWEAVHDYLAGLGRQLTSEGTAAVVADAPPADQDRRAVTNRVVDLANRREALRQGVEGWADETLAITGTWDFDLGDVAVNVDWWHGSEDTTVPLAAAQRLAAQLPRCQLHVVEGSGHLIDGAPILADLART
jgi:pimeloyl-ACP methyl ester carboxylesterase